MKHVTIFFIALLLLAGAATGCGPSKPKRYAVQGEVRYNGELIPRGSIVFTPDSGRGTIGQQTVTSIHEGRYSIDAKNGVVAGHILVEVNGTHDLQDSDSGPLGKPLFDRHQEHFEMPSGNHQKDFDVAGPSVKIIQGTSTKSPERHKPYDH